MALKAMFGALEWVRAPVEVPGVLEWVRAVPTHQSLAADRPAPRSASETEGHRMVVLRTDLTPIGSAFALQQLRKKRRRSLPPEEAHRSLRSGLVGHLR